MSDFPLDKRSGTAAMIGVISRTVLVNLSRGSCPLSLQVAICIMNQKADAISVVAQWHIPPHAR